MNKSIVFLIVLVFSFLSLQAYAENFDLGEIVVSPTRTPHILKDVPVSTSVTTDEDIERITVHEIADIFENIPGLTVVRYGGTGSQSGVYLRGLYSIHTLVMQNGRPLNLPDVGTPILETIHSFNVDKVEVVKGPHSALYGANAVAGVINIIKKPPPREKKEAAVDLSYGSYKTWKAVLAAGSPLDENGVAGVRLDGGYLNSEGHRDNSEAEKSALEVFFQSDAWNDGLFDLSVGYNFSDAGNPGSKPSADLASRTPTQMTYGNNDVSTLKDSADEKLWFVDAVLKVGQMNVKGYMNTRENNFYQSYALYAGDRNKRHTNNQNRSSALELQYEQSFKDTHLFTGGASFVADTYENMDDVTSLTFGTQISTSIDEKRDTFSLYLQDQIAFKNWFLQLGLRYDNPSDYDGQLSPKLAALYHVSEKTRIRTSVGQAYRPPTLSELKWPEDAFTRGNSDLDTETSIAFDLGGEYEASDTCLLRANVFYQKTRDMIQWAPTGPITAWGTPKWQPDNLNEVETVGLEAEARFVLGNHVKGLLAYTLTDAEQTSSEIANAYTSALAEVTRQARFIPRNKVDFLVDFIELGIEGLMLSLDVHYVDEQPNYYTDYSSMNFGTGAVPTVEKTLSSYTMVNCKITKKWDGFEAYAGINNLLDEDYSTRFGADLNDLDYPMPGTNATVGVKIMF